MEGIVKAREPRGYSGFQVKWIMEGLFWVEISIQDFLRGRKFGMYFCGWLDLNRDVLGIQNNLKIRGSACVSRPHSSANIVQPNLFGGCFNI